MNEQQFLQTILVLPVHDIQESTDWYADMLGFETVYIHSGDREDEPDNYAILQRDTAVVHLILDEAPDDERAWAKAGTGYLYLIVRDVEEVFAKVQSRGIKITRGLQREDWPARGFNFSDPSGNDIHFEQPID